MDSLVKRLVRAISPTPWGDVLMHADQMLIELKRTDHHDEIDASITMNDEVDSHFAVAIMEYKMINSFSDILSDHGIVYNDVDITIYMKSVEAIYRIGEYDDMDSIRLLLDECDDPITLYSETLGLLIDDDPMIISGWVADITSVFSNSLERLIRERETETGYDPIDNEPDMIDKKKDDRIYRYLEMGKAPIFKRYLEDGLLLGKSFKYYRLAMEDAILNNESITAREHAEEVVAWMLAAGDTNETIAIASINYIEPFYADNASSLLGVSDHVQRLINIDIHTKES